ncbi:DctP family TRAP transporter solute-binding subunit [Ammoniphilus sp. CFH 90114]|uniref:TRAP transporter substrate-binding protein n=1 Tax=Ammoniphilus sp. CFH 90114 TaxID=2493665 RepID=UPI00100E34F4|nr:DctP family TRAP transporter solute-binding subunit [Ammoniphilus sp. CFH 90114]RXT07085.1 DctP family TRAP transporter solute-binding subunit [Ammoniphilus sp. CFH 90114]
MKKLTSFLMASVLLVLTACGGGNQTQPAASESNSSSATAPAAKSGEFNLRIAHLVPENHSSHLALEKFKETVETKTEGRVKVTLYPNGSLFGSDREAIEAVQLGNVEMTLPALAPISGFNKKFMVFDLPFLFKSEEAARNALDGELGTTLLKDLEGNGFKGLVFAENGFRHMSNNVKPIQTPEDLKGIKFRTLESPVHTATFNAFGANASPFAFGELYTALQQKVYDAMECPISLYYTNKFYEVQKYLTLSGHVYMSTILLSNLDFYNSLPADVQKVIEEASVEFRDYQRQLCEEQNDKFLADLKASGMEVNELTSEQKDAFVAASKPVYDEFAAEIGQDLIDLALKSNE